ncbi:snare associated Golgi protein-domain-containing protein [Phascolomyces articulosus]|uniref:Golgi apparatus membrane protein TVP38 n=1 Tax=Phascolomyces articulosus TaxID=60185 RepID=A0AAD5KKM4_9FUNG|nr:snare associated Golgi protein-domain-containing protein [Phascolomyces articulosus]
MDRSKIALDAQQRVGAIALGGDSHLLATPNENDDIYEMNTEEVHEARNQSVSINASNVGEQIYWFPPEGSQQRGIREHITQIRQALTRERIWQFAKRWKWILVMTAISGLIMLIAYIYRRELAITLEQLSDFIKRMGASGYLLLGLLIFLSGFPPMIGYGLYQTLSGFTFGFAAGFPLSYFSALAGAVSCFVISRMWFKDRVQRFMLDYPNLHAVVRAVEKSGFKLFLLIRISPYPFNILNVLFAATDISLKDFALGTAISLTKIALHIYIGSSFTSFAKRILGDDSDLTDDERTAETIRIVSAIAGSILSFGVMIYIYIITKRAVAQINNNEETDAESMAFLNRNEPDNSSLVEWMDWNEEDDDDDDNDNNQQHTPRQRTSADVERGI